MAAAAVLTGTGAMAATAAPMSTAQAESPTASTVLDPSKPQEPFLCTTQYNDLGQPIVDNGVKKGTPVYPETTPGTPDLTKKPVGWSQRCQVADQVEYRYRTAAGAIKTLAPGATELPNDIAYLATTDLVGTDRMNLGSATQIPYLFRYQRGTLPTNRFIYSIAMLVPFDEYLGSVGADGPWNQRHWNGRLVFSFDGGVGIGHSQGDLSNSGSQMNEALRLGHAVVYSSGTRTSTQYNLMLGGRTAAELKSRFVADHGEPLYTVGIGGSGGGIQQYVYAQNHPDLLDGLIPQYSYPDMTTQTINVGDCELLEHYMDVLDVGNPRWQNWDNRKILQGQNSIEGFSSDWQERTGDTGSSECIEGWRGATPLALNPTFGLAVGEDQVVLPYAAELLGKIGAGQPAVPDDFPDLGRLLRTSADPREWVEWTHWADVAEVYGIDPVTGYARVPWDNVGVQYGLRAVADGTITPGEFLDLNAKVGSWKPSSENTPESCGMVKAMAGDTLGAFGKLIGLCTGDELDQYSSRQMNFSTDASVPAPRYEADVSAITAAFASGLEFDGKLPRDVPILDVRHYLEDQLNMHNAHQSFVTRERIKRTQGNADNQVIWFLDARPGIDDEATDRLYDQGFRVMDSWLATMIANPGTRAADAKPTGAVDSCWSTNGTPIARGNDVWSGANELVLTGAGTWTGSAPTEVDGVPVGACSAHFPLHSTSRVVAGGPITNDVYKCYLKPVAQAMADGDYGEWVPSAEQQTMLEKINPTGVCDYSKRSVGYPGMAPPTPPPIITGSPSTTSTPAPTSIPSPSSTTTTVPSSTTTVAAGPHLGAPGPDGSGTNPDDGYDNSERNGRGALARTGFGLLGFIALAMVLLAIGAATTRSSHRRQPGRAGSEG